MDQRESENETEDKQTLCVALLFTIFTVIFNGYAVDTFVKGLIEANTFYTGAEFDCHFYPKIPVLAVLLFLTALTELILILMIASFWYLDPIQSPVGSFVLKSLYILFGPIICAVCFFFLFHMETYGYTCTTSGKQVYNTTLLLVASVFGTFGALITAGSCVTSIIRKLSYLMTRRNGCCANCMNFFITGGEKSSDYDEGEVDEDERTGLRIQSQL